jgi:hypothetical protein
MVAPICAQLPQPSRVRLPYFPKLGQRAQSPSTTLVKCVTYHSNHRRANLQMQAANRARRSLAKLHKSLCGKHFGV